MFRECIEVESKNVAVLIMQARCPWIGVSLWANSTYHGAETQLNVARSSTIHIQRNIPGTLQVLIVTSYI